MSQEVASLLLAGKGKELMSLDSTRGDTPPLRTTKLV